MPLIDSHTHLDSVDYDADLGLVLKRAKKADVCKIISVGADLARSEKVISIANKYDNIWATVGIHPEDVGVDLLFAEEKISKLAKSSNKVVAIGECGLDYFYDETNKEQQQTLFETQIKVAQKLELPLVIHIRNGKDDLAAKNAYEILVKNKVNHGVIHCFTLEKEWTEKFLDMGLYIGFTAIVTYKNADLVRDAVRVVPINKLLVETDCPYLAPQKYRGERNEPAYVVEIANKIAEIKKLSLAEVEDETRNNTEHLFKI